MRLRSFSVYSLDNGAPTVSPGLIEAAGALNMAVAAPTSGTWPRGKTVTNATPAVVAGGGGNYVVDGWRKVTTGSTNVLGVDWVELRCPTA